MSDIASDYCKTIGKCGRGDTAILGTGAFDLGRPCLKDFVGVIIVPKNGNTVQFPHKIKEKIIRKRKVRVFAGAKLIDIVEASAQHFFWGNRAEVDRTDRGLRDTAFDLFVAAQKVGISIGIENVHRLLRHVPFRIHLLTMLANRIQHFFPKRIILKTAIRLSQRVCVRHF
jgi:hypothetical protein